MVLGLCIPYVVRHSLISQRGGCAEPWDWSPEFNICLRTLKLDLGYYMSATVCQAGEGAQIQRGQELAPVVSEAPSGPVWLAGNMFSETGFAYTGA